MNTIMNIEKSWRDYLELCKPRVVALMLLTVVVGMYLAVPGFVPLMTVMMSLIGIGLCAASAAVINHIVDKKIDSIMARTSNRPLVTGKVASKNALYFAFIIGVLGLLVLGSFVNILTACLTFLTLIGYAGFYTGYLKRATPQNIVIGGLAGAAPPLLGWTAVTNHLDPCALLLVLIIFTWTPPHFWALAIYRLEDYKNASIPMLPVTHGVDYTKLHIVLYTILLFIVTLLPCAVGMSGVIYLIGAVLLNLRFLYWDILLYRSQKNNVALKTFRFSIVYLLMLFVFILLDHAMHLQLA